MKKQASAFYFFLPNPYLLVYPGLPSYLLPSYLLPFIYIIYKYILFIILFIPGKTFNLTEIKSDGGSLVGSSDEGSSLQLKVSVDAQEEIERLEQQLGIGGTRGMTLSSSAVTLVKKQPRKVGPRPWFTHGGKSKMIVSSSSLSNQFNLALVDAGSSDVGGGTGQTLGEGKIQLNDGFDDSESVVGRARARAHSAQSNRWGGRGGGSVAGASVASLGEEGVVAARAARWDESHPKVSQGERAKQSE